MYYKLKKEVESQVTYKVRKGLRLQILPKTYHMFFIFTLPSVLPITVLSQMTSYHF